VSRLLLPILDECNCAALISLRELTNSVCRTVEDRNIRWH